MLKIGDLPTHPLIVHAPVVLVPLVAIGLIAFFAMPSWRRPLGLVLAGLAAVAAGAAILAVASGEQLGDALGRGAELDTHRSFGERARLFTILLALATGALVLYHRRGTRSEPWLRRGTAAVGVLGVAAVASVFLTGHTGAELAWAQRLPDDDLIASNAATLEVGPGAAGAAAVSVPSSTSPSISGHGTDHGGSTSSAPSTTDDSTSSSAPSTSSPDAAAASATGADLAARPEVHVVLGEWALITSVSEAPPGPITFRFHNAGTVAHAFRIRSEEDDHGDDHGGDRDEWRSVVVAPGQEATLTADLSAGQYELDCPIEDGHGEHDALGMEAPFSVSPTAPPLTAPTTAAPPTPAPSTSAPSTSAPSRSAAPTPPPATAPTTATVPTPSTTPRPADDSAPTSATVRIQGFTFQPAEVRIRAGGTVTWINEDPATHDATGDSWTTGPLPAGASATVTFRTPGVYTYRCTIHPSMTGTIVVDP